MMPRVIALVGCVVAATACGDRDAAQGAIGARVHFAEGVRSRCVQVVARASDGVEIATDPVPADGDRDLLVAIYPGANLSGAITLTAHGYASATCTPPLQTNDVSAPLEVAFKPGEVVRVTLELRPPPADEDLDGDGYRAASAGGPDCDDALGDVHPHAQERCANDVDDDCSSSTDCDDPACTAECAGREHACGNGLDDDADGMTDCADSDCDGRACDDGDACTEAQVCGGGGCGAGTPVVCQAPPEGCTFVTGCDPVSGCAFSQADAGTPCDGGVCTAFGGCAPAFPYPPSNFDPLLLPAVGGSVSIECPVTFNSTSLSFAGQCDGGAAFAAPVLMGDGGASPVVLAARDLYIAADAGLRLIGQRPVILAIHGSARIAGEIDVSATGAIAGAGGSHDRCGARAGGDGRESGTSNGGGGGGGAYAVDGRQGGNGSAGKNQGAAGKAAGTSTLVPLEGGCSGGAGGADGGLGGGGGGAVQVSAVEGLEVSGLLSAGGGGGHGAPPGQAGGGGGGSGGGILLEGAQVEISPGARVTANGGAGGEGAGMSSAGAPGEDGRPSTMAAVGGSGGSNAGGNGGNGGVGGSDGQDGQNGTGPGGGGGGGGGGSAAFA